MERDAEELRQRKKECRARWKAWARSLPDRYLPEAGRAMADMVLTCRAFAKAETVMLFVSMPGEPDTRWLVEEAVRRGKKVLLPRCEDESRMIPLPFNGWDRLIPGRWSIPEPEETNLPVPEPDVIVVPCMAATREGKRLGHGAGYYDRFLMDRKAVRICLCPEKLLAEDLPTGPLDAQMDLVITENSVFGDFGDSAAEN